MYSRMYLALTLWKLPTIPRLNLDNAAKLFFRLDQRRTDFVAHAVGGFVRAEAHHPLNLKGANAFLAGQHQVNDLEPLSKRLVGVLENGPGNVGEAVALVRSAGV